MKGGIQIPASGFGLRLSPLVATNYRRAEFLQNAELAHYRFFVPSNVIGYLASLMNRPACDPRWTPEAGRAVLLLVLSTEVLKS
jgi:hypothetical protein